MPIVGAMFAQVSGSGSLFSDFYIIKYSFSSLYMRIAGVRCVPAFIIMHCEMKMRP